MNIKVNKININIGKVGAVAIPAASVCLIIFEPSARICSAIALAAFAVLVVWNLSRGGSVAFPGLTLSGRRSAKPRASRGAALRRPPARPVNARPAAASRGGPGLAVVLVPIAAAVGLFVAGNASHAATGRPRALDQAGPASVARAYYAAVNRRNWPKAWQLAGNSDRGYGPAYHRWVDGYNCTVWDQITRITSRGDRLLVLVRARETGGVVQDYRFSYVVSDGVLTQPRTLKFSGHAPQGCGS